MSYSNSTFTIEISGMAAAVFKAKWYSEADEICRAWAQRHWEQLTTKGQRGSDLPAVVRLRLARADEKAAYDQASEEAEHHDGVKVVILVDVKERPWAQNEQAIDEG
jgi:hypothetical protein